MSVSNVAVIRARNPHKFSTSFYYHTCYIIESFNDVSKYLQKMCLKTGANFLFIWCQLKGVNFGPIIVIVNIAKIKLIHYFAWCMIVGHVYRKFMP